MKIWKKSKKSIKEETLKIRDFLYFDTDLIKSIYSQLNSGVVESYSKSSKVSENSVGNIGINSQFIPINAKISKSFLFEDTYNKNFVLNDFMYNHLEAQLIQNNSLINIDSNTRRNELVEIYKTKQLFLMDGCIEIKNMQFLNEIINNYGKIMEAMQIVTNEKTKKDYATLNKIKSIEVLLKYFFNYDVWLKCYVDRSSDCNFSANLKRENFRDSIERIVYNYTSIPEGKWKILGQILCVPTQNREILAKDIKSTELFNGMSDIFNSLAIVENFSSIAYPEISFKPLVIYKESN